MYAISQKNDGGVWAKRRVRFKNGKVAGRTRAGSSTDGFDSLGQGTSRREPASGANRPFTKCF